MATPITNQTAFAAFITELINRLFSKTPTFFKWIQGISTVIGIVGLIPSFFDVTLLGDFWSVVAQVIGVTGLVISQLTVEAKTAKVAAGELPYTAKKDENV